MKKLLARLKSAITGAPPRESFDYASYIAQVQSMQRPGPEPEPIPWSTRVDRVEAVPALDLPGCTVTLDASEQVVRLDGGGSSDPDTWAPYPSFASLDGDARFVSAAELAVKAKQFDDGLYAAVELAAQRGAGSYPSKRELLRGLIQKLKDGQQGGAVVAAAASLGGLNAQPPPSTASAAAQLQHTFLQDPFGSKPIGFYTWSEELSRIFQQDRMLQSKLNSAEAFSLANVLAEDAELRTAYNALVELPCQLTNPFARADLRGLVGEPAPGGEYAFLPPSIAPETNLLGRLYGDSVPPDGFNLADQLIAEIQAGRLSLEPKPGSGWYDHQLHALEPLVRPEHTFESQHLELSPSYREELLGLFKALLAMTRETHTKQLEIPLCASISMDVTVVPNLSVEPLATYYLRRARAYAFVRQVLEGQFGAENLNTLQRLTPDGPLDLPLSDELSWIQALFHGAYLTTCHELGLSPEDTTDVGSLRDMNLFKAWAAERSHDPDLMRDVRMMVPVAYDVVRRKMKVWVVLGVDFKLLELAFARPPELVSVVGDDGAPIEANVVYEGAVHGLRHFVTAEVYVSRILNRDEMRALCNKHKTVTGILAALERL